MKKPFDKTLYDIADTTAKQKMIDGWNILNLNVLLIQRRLLILI